MYSHSLTLQAMFQALFVFPPEFQMILKERAVGRTPTWAPTMFEGCASP